MLYDTTKKLPCPYAKYVWHSKLKGMLNDYYSKHEGVTVVEMGEKWQILCTTCGASGPQLRTKKDAILGWNAITIGNLKLED